MKKRITGLMGILITLGLLFITACSKTDGPGGFNSNQPADFDSHESITWTNVCDAKLSTVLLAGKYTPVGVVEVWRDGDYLYVAYKIDDPTKWAIAQTHLSVTPDLNGVPGYLKNSNPQIGLFNFNDHENVTDFTYQIALNNPKLGGSKNFVILAHAVVNNLTASYPDGPDMEGFNASLPLTAMEAIWLYGTAEPRLSYNKTEIYQATQAWINGTYLSWCIDLEDGIANGRVKAFSSYDPYMDLTLIVDKPQNLDLVNWILNQNFIGKTATNGELFTAGDIQTAIWSLLDNIGIPSFNAAQGPWSLVRVNEIISLSSSHEGYTPGCGERVAILLQPIDAAGGFVNIQTTLITYPLPCVPHYGHETAWAAGNAFPGNSWAMWFSYCVN